MYSLLFIVESMPDKFFIEKFGMDFYEKKGLKVEILYVASVTRNNYYKNTPNTSVKKFYDGKDKSSIIKYLNKNTSEKTIVFCFYGHNSNSIFINNFLSSKKIKTASYTLDHSLQKKLSFFNKIKILIFSPFLFIKLLIIKINYRNRHNVNFDYIFTAGKASEQTYKLKSKSKIFKVHHYDFDIFNKAKKFTKNKNYGLFLSPATINPDTFDLVPGVHNKKNSNWNRQFYFKTMRLFINKLEKISDCEILVAQHPKDKTNLEKKLYKKCYKGMTANLVKNSKFVFCFDSQAFQFAVMDHKPIIFLTANYLPKLVKDDIKDRSSFFKTQTINIENEFSKKQFNSFFKINKNIYKKYLNLYITTTKKSFYKYKSFELIYRYIKKISKN